MSADSRDCGPGHTRCTATRRIGSLTVARIATAAVALAAGTAHPALAATFFSPFAAFGYQYNSNLFMRPSSAPAFAGEGLGDSILDYEAGLGTELDWGADRLTLDASGTRDDYDRFSFLDHYEYLFDGNFHWQLTRAVEGTVTYEQTREIAPFTDTFTTALLLDTDRTAAMPVHVLVTPEWRLDLTPELHQNSTPLPGFAGFALHETAGIAGLDYLGFGRLTAGVQFIYDTGRYEQITAATRYQQHEFDLTASYKVGGFSTLGASAGYTRRDSEANPADSVQAAAGTGNYAGYGGVVGKTSGVTGTLTYQREFTGKTSGNLSVFRRVDSYAAGANPEIGTGGAVGVTWKADPKITVNLNYSLARDQVEGGLVVLNAVNRTDRTRTAEFQVHYFAVSWLTIRPYVDWNKASSTVALGNYSGWIAGVDVTGRLRW